MSATGPPGLASLPNSQLLTSENFSALDYINSTFTTTSSLETNLSSFSSQISSNISSLDGHISHAIQSQSSSNTGASKTGDIDQARTAIMSLKNKIEDIAMKADKSERMVQVICQDIKQLDYAKRHLQTTITALKRLHMLVNAVQQLSTMASSKQYASAANLLDAVSQLTVHFIDFQNVPKIADLTRTVESVREDLSKQIFEAFEEIGELASGAAKPEDFERDVDSEGEKGGFSNLKEACLVVDALGHRAKQRQISSFCDSQLKSYSKIFRPTEEHSSLDSVDRRFAWFRRLLKSIDERFESVFPPHWHLQYKICLQFLQQTRESLQAKLEDDTSPDSENVIVIVKALQKSLMFEKEMTSRFERDYGSSVENTTVDKNQTYDADMEYDSDGNTVDPRSARGIKMRYLRERAKKKAIAEKTGDTTPQVDEHALLPIQGMLSGVFHPYMGPYVALERQNLEEQLANVVADSNLDNRGEMPVFTSSINLFVYMKNSINRCCALTTGLVFFNLYKEYKAALKSYAKTLLMKIPQPYVSSMAMAAQQLRKDKDDPVNPKMANYRLPSGEETTVCHVIDTCEYCVDTIEALEELIKDKIDESYKDTVDMMDEGDEFGEGTTIALRVLISGLENRLEAGFKEFGRINWGEFDDVGEESPYVQTMTATISQFFDLCQKSLPSIYYRNLCDKFAANFLKNYNAALLKVKRYSDISTQQILLDVYSLKSLILKLPILNGSGIAPNMYVTHCTKEFQSIEILLKLIGTTVSILVEVFRQQKPDGSMKDLQVVMQAKGIKRVQQQELLEQFGGEGGV